MASSPLFSDQEIQQAGGGAPSTATASPHPDGSLFSGQEIQAASGQPSGQDTGEVTNDVGNAVLMQKEGESYPDFMKRVVAHGKTVTQDQIDKEMATAPKKVATVLAAAPAIGFGGEAALTGAAAAPGAIANGAEKLLQISETALEHLAENYPQLTKLATKLGYGVGAAGAYKLLNKLGIH